MAALLRAVLAMVAVTALLSLVTVHADAAVCETYQNNDLIRKCGNKYFNLEKVKGQDGTSLLNAVDAARGYIFYMEFEDGGVPQKLPNCTLDEKSNLGVQVRTDGGGCFVLGKSNLVNWDFDNSTDQLTITTTGGQGGRSMSIKTQCVFGANYATLQETGETGLTYNFNLNLPNERCTTTPPRPPPSGSHLSHGALIGIVCGAVVAVSALIAVVFLYIRRKRSSGYAPLTSQDRGRNTLRQRSGGGGGAGGSSMPPRTHQPHPVAYQGPPPPWEQPPSYAAATAPPMQTGAPWASGAPSSAFGRPPRPTYKLPDDK